MRRWYVIYTRTGMERLAQGHLERQGFGVYLPHRLKQRRHARRVDTIKVPLFPRYIFVAFDISADRWQGINGTHGVSYLVGVGEHPSAAPVGVVEAIREREDAEGLVNIADPDRFAPGEVVEITQGALADQVGIFKCSNDSQRVTLLLGLLGRETEIQLPAAAIRAYA